MKVREFAKANGVEVVGKLTRKVAKTRKPFEIDEYFKEIYWEDEAGNQFFEKGYICLADGSVI